MNTINTFEGFKLPQNAEKYKKEIQQYIEAHPLSCTCCCIESIDDLSCIGMECTECIMHVNANNNKALKKWLSIETPIAENTQITTTTRVLSYIIHPFDRPIFDENATNVKIEDEGAGEFIEITQCPDTGSQTIRINPEEWPAIKNAVEKLLESID